MTHLAYAVLIDDIIQQISKSLGDNNLLGQNSFNDGLLSFP
jgi:tRNA G37 N-methylase TrmD